MLLADGLPGVFQGGDEQAGRRCRAGVVGWLVHRQLLVRGVGVRAGARLAAAARPVSGADWPGRRHRDQGSAAGSACSRRFQASGSQPANDDLSEQGQVTDRYTKAIDQLDKSKTLAVKLGALYELERIAHDSPQDRRRIAEVLCAYARTADRPEPPVRLTNFGGPPDGDTAAARTQANKPRSLTVRAPDVQAAVTILGAGRGRWAARHRSWTSTTPSFRSWACPVRSCRARTSPVRSCRARLSGACVCRAR
jgi:hypothetical protein